jgi:hypothetical protein
MVPYAIMPCFIFSPQVGLHDTGLVATLSTPKCDQLNAIQQKHPHHQRNPAKGQYSFSSTMQRPCNVYVFIVKHILKLQKGAASMQLGSCSRPVGCCDQQACLHFSSSRALLTALTAEHV